MADKDTSATTAASQRRVLFSGAPFHLPKFWVTRLTEVHHIRPSGLPLACDLWMEQRSLGFLPGFTPRRCQRRIPGAGTSVEHSLGANRRTFSTLHFRLSHSLSATSRRTSLAQSTPAVTRTTARSGAILTVLSSLLPQWEDTRWSRDTAAGRSLIGAHWRIAL